jgi:hypothetical protein
MARQEVVNAKSCKRLICNWPTTPRRITLAIRSLLRENGWPDWAQSTPEGHRSRASILARRMGHDEEEPKLFTLTEAERTRRQLEPLLIEAVETRRKLLPLDDDLEALAARIQTMGGIVVPYEKTARVRFDRDRLAESLSASVQKIEATGCVLKDLDTGLLDFPAIVNNEEVYLCWRLGEERIRFYHRQDEGFSARKPIDPGDIGSSDPIQ